MVRQLLLIELNEINFPLMQKYIGRDQLPTFSRLIHDHGFATTTSEENYDELEPWIQWVSAHTALKLSEHGVFRLGDILLHDHPQIWEILETQGLKVGAVSPMNAKNRCVDPAFFLPDPWTNTTITAGPILRGLHGAIGQVVNDNARFRLTAFSILRLIAGIATYARWVNYGAFLLLASSLSMPWRRAAFLDLLLADVFIRETKRTNPNFASLFLNAGAHIQHHYMFNSAVYEGTQSNPDWYVRSGGDPLLDIYKIYDRILDQILRAFPQARIMIATGLHQDPHPETTFYWRLKDHVGFLSKHGIPFVSVGPKMSRDFVVFCASPLDAHRASAILNSIIAQDGSALFSTDNRGTDLFVSLVYPRNIDEDFLYWVGNQPFEKLRSDVTFVAIKNGQHNGTGYFLDTKTTTNQMPTNFLLQDLPFRICEALDAKWPEKIAAKL